MCHSARHCAKPANSPKIMERNENMTRTNYLLASLLASATLLAVPALAEIPVPQPVEGLPTELNAIASFYQNALTVTEGTTPTEVIDAVVADGFQSINIEGAEDEGALAGQLEHFWMLVPDLRWDIQEVIVSGDRVVVRSIASGSPKGNFFGLDLDGSKSFKIDTIDIHTLRDGKIETVHHVEGWATAMQQLTQ